MMKQEANPGGPLFFVSEEKLKKHIELEVAKQLSLNTKIYAMVEKRVEGVLHQLIKEEAFKQGLHESIKKTVRNTLSKDLKPFAEELWRVSSSKFSKTLTRRMKDIVNLKTSTVQEINKNLREAPIESDKEFLEDLNKEINQIAMNEQQMIGMRSQNIKGIER